MLAIAPFVKFFKALMAAIDACPRGPADNEAISRAVWNQYVWIVFDTSCIISIWRADEDWCWPEVPMHCVG